MSLERWRNSLAELLTDDRWIKAVGLAGAAFLLTGTLFVVFGGPIEPPAAGSGGVAPVTAGTDDGWTDMAGFAFLVLGALMTLTWGAIFGWPKLRDLRR